MTRQLGLFYKERGMALADVDADWRREADRAIRNLAIRGTPFTAEDVRAYAGEPSHPNALGARLSAAQRRGVIVFTGEIVTATPHPQHRGVPPDPWPAELERYRAERDRENAAHRRRYAADRERWSTYHRRYRQGYRRPLYAVIPNQEPGSLHDLACPGPTACRCRAVVLR